MTDRKRIPTPWRHRWRRFRYSSLPVISFAACVALTIWLWGKQTHLTGAVGTVEAVRVPVASGVDGLLMPLQQPHWTLFDRVEKGWCIAKLDDGPTLAALDTLRSELAGIGKEIDATQAQLASDQVDRVLDHARERTRLVWDQLQLMRDELERKALIAIDRAKQQELEVNLRYLSESRKRLPGSVTQQVIDETNAQLEVVFTSIRENNKVLEEVLKQKQQAEMRLAAYPPEVVTPNEVAMFAPIQARIKTQEARIVELDFQVKELVITAPMSGTIAAVYKVPGQQVQAFDPIIAIAGDERRYILSYIRQDQRIHPFEGMPVTVRSRVPGQKLLEAEVERIGPQFEPIPVHLLRDPTRPEIALPVKISYPRGFDARPGEPVDLGFLVRSNRSG